MSVVGLLVRPRGRHARERLPVGRARAATAARCAPRFVRPGDRRRRHPLRGARPHAAPRARRGRPLVPLEAAAGTLVVLHGLLPHWRGPNRVGRSRHAYTVHVIEGGARVPGGQLAPTTPPSCAAPAGSDPTRSNRRYPSSMRPTIEAIRRAPKVLLHDHLDGGLRPTTVIELAAEHGYTSCPPPTRPSWRPGSPRAPTAATSTSTSRPSSTPSACMQHADAIERVAAECVEDLADRRRRLRRGAHGPRAVHRGRASRSTRRSRPCCAASEPARPSTTSTSA